MYVPTEVTLVRLDKGKDILSTAVGCRVGILEFNIQNSILS